MTKQGIKVDVRQIVRFGYQSGKLKHLNISETVLFFQTFVES